jgi:hypothetical protein
MRPLFSGQGEVFQEVASDTWRAREYPRNPMNVYRKPPQARARVALSVPVLPPRVLGPESAKADFLEVDAEIFDVVPGCAYELARVEVEAAGQIDNDPFEPYSNGSRVEDVWIAADGARARFRVRPAEGLRPVGTQGIVRAIFRRCDDDAEIVASALFQTGPEHTLILPSGTSTSRAGFYSGPVPTATLIVNADSIVHVGLRMGDADDIAAAHSVRACWRVLRFDTWLDGSVRGTVDVAPTIEIPRGRVKIQEWNDWCATERCVQIWYDPRSNTRRLEIGRHPMTIGWSVHSDEGSVTHRTVVHIVVRSDGTIELDGA